MKSVKDLYQEYSFADATDNLMTMINDTIRSNKIDFFSHASTKLTIPNPIMQVFLMNPDSFKNWLLEMESLGYKFSATNNNRIEIIFRVNEELEQDQVDFFNKIPMSNKKEAVNIKNLLGSDVLTCLKHDLLENRSNWTFSKSLDQTKLNIKRHDRSLNSLVEMEISRSKAFAKYRNHYFLFSKNEKEDLESFISENFDPDQDFLENIKKHFSQK